MNSRCGRGCFYCRPSGEAVATPPKAALSAQEVISVTEILASLGLTEVKLTGGDPALWLPLIECAGALKKIEGLRLEVISRHPLIGDLAQPLVTAGTDMINVSIDTLKPELHRLITTKDDLPALLTAIQKVIATGVPCKINMVVMRGVNDQEVMDLVAYCEAAGVHTLKLLDMIEDLDDGTEAFGKRLKLLKIDPQPKSLKDLYLPLGTISETLRKRAVESKQAYQGGLGHPMSHYVMASGLNVLVKDHHAGAWFGSVCDGCRHFPCHDALMALRLTADMRLQFCLLREDVVLDLRPAVQAGPWAVREMLEEAVAVYQAAEFRSAQPPMPELTAGGA